ncbi:MAG: extracellular solute-binding protein [Anaerolineales bacterium]|nr:extracellular solute-binding protein [Anaerolineales bacterium]
MTHKIFTLLSIILIAVFALSGCATPATTVPTEEAVVEAEPTQPAPTEPPAEPTAAEAEVEPTVEEQPQVTVTWWHIQVADDQKALWQGMADEYMAAHPNVTVEITVLENEAFKTKITTMMQSGNPPDIFQSWGGGGMNEYAIAGLLKDITADLEKDGWKDTFSPGALGVFSFEGKYYGVPRDMGAVGFWYNKDLFAQAGIEAPPTTWSEFLEDIQTLKAAGITPIALGEGDKWPGAFYWEYLAVRIGGQAAFDAAYSRKGAFTDEPFVEAGVKLQELVALDPFQEGFLGATWPDEQVVMASEKAAMDLMGQWAPGAFKDASVDKQGLGDKLGWFPFPAVEGGAGDPADALGGGNGFVVGKDAEPEAVDFLKYISSVESQIAQAEIGLSVPVVKGAEVGLTDPMLVLVQQGAAAAKYFQLYYDQAMPPAVGGVVNDAVQGVFAGTLTPEECAAMIEESAQMELK